jgi:hypothetical protein
MFLSQAQVRCAVEEIESIHPFFGISFLVFKEANLPVGRTVQVLINHKEDEFLNKYYRPQSSSSWFYRAFRVSDKSQFWLRPDYASKGSQSVRTRTFKAAFLHTKGTDEWGWKNDYVAELRNQLNKQHKIPAYHLAVWLYRDCNEWSEETRPEDILKTFQDQFNFSDVEKTDLLDMSIPEIAYREPLVAEQQFSWEQLTRELDIPPPPDAPLDEGGTLAILMLEGVGPAKELRLEFSERTNLLTGDNGLGKSFVLESAWWALSGSWTSFQAFPRADAHRDEPKIGFQILGKAGKSKQVISNYSWEEQAWSHPKDRPTIPGLLIYAKVDGAFAVWDPARDYWGFSSNSVTSLSKPLLFSREDVWDGLSSTAGGKTSYLSNGLIDDWINWQNNPEQETFETLKKVLLRLSPPGLDVGDLGQLEPGKPRRIPGDSRLMPTIKHSYGEVPVVYASAGVKRIIALAYLIVWVWEEHKTQSMIIRKPPQRRMVILIDEIEAHLHPQWQRMILPALFEVWKDLSPDIQIQMIIATHSPLVMASMEPFFDLERDKIFHVNLVRSDLLGMEVKIESPSFVKYGTADSWLRSEIFELKQARSIDAEKAIEDAVRLQLQAEISPQDVAEVSKRLVKYLPSHDTFWPRWTYFAEQHGVDL